MVFDYTSTEDDPAAMIESLLVAGSLTGWTSGQIRNTTAGTTGLTLGWADDTTGHQVTVMATYAGDFNIDGEVNLADLDIWKANVGLSSPTFAMGDSNYDGAVNLGDLDAWKATVGFSVAGSFGSMSVGSPVPEPGTFALLLPVAAWFGYVVARQRRRKA